MTDAPLPVRSAPAVLVLTGLRLRSLVEGDELAAATGLPAAVVEEHLAAFADEGWVRHREGRLSGWMLTTAGRAEGERLLAEELERSGVRPAVEAAYGRFLSLNGGFLALCTDWQQIEPGVINDHGDPDHDARVIERLGAVDAAIAPVCDELAGLLERFAGYRRRFSTALARVREGEGEWFAKPLIDSYHTVWFELHEHLLATLNLDRAKETAP